MEMDPNIPRCRQPLVRYRTSTGSRRLLPVYRPVPMLTTWRISAEQYKQPVSVSAERTQPQLQVDWRSRLADRTSGFHSCTATKNQSETVARWHSEPIQL